MKKILLFGAGKSATELIRYLLNHATENNIFLTVADADENLALSKTKNNPHSKVVSISVGENHDKLTALITEADIVLSLLPPSLHIKVAEQCVANGKNLITASYVDDAVKNLAPQIESKNLLFLYEMGLDPGIDHMSAMKLINQIKNKGGVIKSFYSHCGGLMAPETHQNSWHYKITWNAKNVVDAGKAGAIYKEDGENVSETFEQLFNSIKTTVINDVQNLNLAYYPNRNSTDYIKTYNIPETSTFIRTTLRYPNFISGWKHLIDAGLTDDTKVIETENVTIQQFLSKVPFSNMTPLFEKQLNDLGWQDNTTKINLGKVSMSRVLQFILETKWALQAQDRDMVVMQHEILYTLNNQDFTALSTLVVKGEDAEHTAMSKTVGMPMAYAALRILDGTIQEKGLQIPTNPNIYNVVLPELEKDNIRFVERDELSSRLGS